jgi:hypothetical protein
MLLSRTVDFRRLLHMSDARLLSTPDITTFYERLEPSRFIVVQQEDLTFQRSQRCGRERGEENGCVRDYC